MASSMERSNQLALDISAPPLWFISPGLVVSLAVREEYERYRSFRPLSSSSPKPVVRTLEDVIAWTESLLTLLDAGGDCPIERTSAVIDELWSKYGRVAKQHGRKYGICPLMPRPGGRFVGQRAVFSCLEIRTHVARLRDWCREVLMGGDPSVVQQVAAEWPTIDEVALAVGHEHSTVHRWGKAGKFRVVRLGRQDRVEPTSLFRFLRKQNLEFRFRPVAR